MIFRHPTAQDGAEIWRVVRDSEVLDLNSSYCYLMMGHYFSKTCIVATPEPGDATEVSPGIAGFVVGFRPPRQTDTLFIWQVAVDRPWLGKGIGQQLLLELLKRQPPDEVTWLDATISPSNQASHSLFAAAARTLQTERKLSPLFPEQWFPPGHEEEELSRIGPFKLTEIQ